MSADEQVQPDRTARLFETWLEMVRELERAQYLEPQPRYIVAALLVIADSIDYVSDTWAWRR